MTKIKKITTKDATITIDNATTLQFHHNKCYEIERPYISVAAYYCENYVLLHELQGFITDQVIEPKTSAEFEEGLMTLGNPYYFDNYHELYDSLKIVKETENYHIEAFDPLYGLYVYDDKKSFKRFHLFKVDDKAWTEIELDVEKLYNQSLVEWINFANGMICNI